MGASVVAYIALLAIVGLLRLVEIRVSRRNQRYLASHGVAKVPEPHFRWMVIFHTAILVSAGLEVVLLQRPLLPLLAAPMAVLFLLANGLRFWVIRTMSWHWNVEVMDSTKLGVVTGGPYRWVRHPNYVGFRRAGGPAADPHRLADGAGGFGAARRRPAAPHPHRRSRAAGRPGVPRSDGLETALPA
jgi:methyltransferase